MKIVTSTEMACIEKESMAEGASSENYMRGAGEGVARCIFDYVKKNHLPKLATLLIGKGNKGGDAYVAGIELLKNGFNVLALYIYDSKECSELNQLFHTKFIEQGGKTLHLQQLNTCVFQGVIIDGLLGTGCKGEVEGFLKEVIRQANASGLPILSIDIPSGLNGNTGEVKGEAIHAAETYYLGLPKWGFFVRGGYDKIGKLIHVDFGLDKKYVEKAEGVAELFEASSIYLPEIKRSQHKYQRGYVLAIAGSKGMAGAAMLSCLATLRAGAGIVRLFYPQEIEKEISSAFKELIKVSWDCENIDPIISEAKRAGSMMIGPGIAYHEPTLKSILKILSKVKIPCVIDAGALEIFAKEASHYSKECILTPHRQEFLRCLDLDKETSEEEIWKQAQSFVKKKQIVLILKGAPTVIFCPGHLPVVIARGDPGMATAGSGDVLTGIIAALLAQKISAKEAAILGVYIHALSGEKAAKAKTSYSMIASDLIEQLPEVFLDLESC